MVEQRPVLEKIEAFFRNTFVMLSPVILSLVIGMAFIHYFDYQNNLLIQKRLNIWRQKADLTIESVRANFSFSEQFKHYGNKFAEDVELAGPEGFSAASVTKSLFNNFPDSFSLRSLEIWAFEISQGKAKFIKDKNLAGTRLKIMERVLNSLLELSGNPNLSQAKLSSLEKTVKSILGQHSAPLQLGKNREGRLTPITFEGKPCYIYWRQFRNENNSFGAILILVPLERAENAEFAMQHAADRSFEGTKHRLGLAFVPAQGYQKPLPVILPAQFNKSPEEKKKIHDFLTALRDLAETKQDLFFPGINDVFVKENFIFKKDFTSVNVPYDAVVFSPLPENLKKPVIKQSWIYILITGLWLCIFGIFYLKNGRPGLPLAVSFRLLFFLTGIMPLLLMCTIGIVLIDNSHANAVTELRQENLRKLIDLHERSDNLAGLFGNNISRLMTELKLFPLFFSNNPKDISSAFEKLRYHLERIELTLDNMFIFQPGGLTTMVVKDQRMQHKAEVIFNLFGPAAFKLNRQYSELMPLEEIKLNAAQKNYLQIFGGFHSSFLEEIFMHSYEKENVITFGDSSHDYYFSTIISNASQIKSYLVFSTNSDGLFRAFLSRELDSMNISDSALFIAAEELASSEFTIFPFKKLNALNSKAGKSALSFLRQCRSSVFARHISDSENLFLFYPMSKAGKYAGGCIVSLSEINRERDLKKLFLFVSAVLMLCFMYVLSAYASGYLLKPLNEITGFLEQISKGNLESNLQINRGDELGVLSRVLNKMQEGLKTRLLLGKFVSTTFDKSLRHAREDITIQKARKFKGTIIFSDIRSFTTHSESYPPVEIAEMLNIHMEKLSEEIQKRGGQIEQFIGDAIVAFFPDNDDNSSVEKSALAAIGMMQKHQEIVQRRQASGLFVYDIGIGLSYGELVAGPLVTSDRSEFILLGEVKAEAENCEQLSKNAKFSKIVITEKLKIKLSESHSFRFIELEDKFFELMTEATEL